jgi:hypothetical protein
MFYGKIARMFGGGVCPLRCGPDPMVFVDHGGKLFERINAKSLPVAINEVGITPRGKPQ